MREQEGGGAPFGLYFDGIWVADLFIDGVIVLSETIQKLSNSTRVFDATREQRRD